MRSYLGLAIVALLGLCGSRVRAAEMADPAAGLPDPYQAAVRNWAVLPDHRTWGSTAGIEIGPHNEIWAIDRCGVNSCETSDLPPIHQLDLATGSPIKSIGAGLFVFPHGLNVDRAVNIWVVDAAAMKDKTTGTHV